MERGATAGDEASAVKKCFQGITNSPCPSESGGTTCEAVIISRGGKAASHLQNMILKCVLSKVRV